MTLSFLRFFLVFFLFVKLGLAAISPSVSFPALSKDPSQEPTLFFADRVSYNKRAQQVKALGNVELHQENTSLYADEIVYDQGLKTVFAKGNVRLMDHDGNVSFFDQAELSDDLKKGAIHRLSMLMADDARLTAAKAQRKADVQSTFDKVRYSPCTICRQEPEAEPLWQIQAERVIWDEEKETITYVDAFLKIKSVPVFYLPYLQHPAPNVKRKSGFLTPILGGGRLGAIVGVPYFWAIDPHKDLTITPMIVGSKPMIKLNYRQKFTQGDLSVTTSAIYDRRSAKKDADIERQSNEFRGHIQAKGLFNLDDHWRTGFDINRSSDQTYLRKFSHLGSFSKSMLISRGFLESFYGRNYFLMESYDFQGLRKEDVSSRTPAIVPLMEGFVQTKPLWQESYLTFQGHFSSVHRRIGANMTKASLNGAWLWPQIFKQGHKLTTEASIRTDAYTYTHAYSAKDSRYLGRGTETRAIPRLSTLLEYPMVQYGGTTRLTLEPLAMVTAAPVANREKQFPNEDSRTAELNDINVFSSSRFAGLDRVDGGSRAAYGINTGVITEKYGKGSLLLAQSYAFQKPGRQLINTGLERQLSDYVVRLKGSYKDWFEIAHRSLLDRNRLSSKRQNLTTSFGQPIARLHVDYVYLPNISMTDTQKRTEQVGLRFSSEINDNWSFGLKASKELGKNGGILSQGIEATYKDECFTTHVSLEKTRYKDRDFNPGVIFLVRLVFKNLGDVRQETEF